MGDTIRLLNDGREYDIIRRGTGPIKGQYIVIKDQFNVEQSLPMTELGKAFVFVGSVADAPIAVEDHMPIEIHDEFDEDDIDDEDFDDEDFDDDELDGGDE